jgi:hypothetical protein
LSAVLIWWSPTPHAELSDNPQGCFSPFWHFPQFFRVGLSWQSPRPPIRTRCGSSGIPFTILTLFQHLRVQFLADDLQDPKMNQVGILNN